MTVLIIGAGCTGAATAYRLRQKLGPNYPIHVWEKARGAGGRYTTAKDSYPDGLKADMGAQYASVDPEDADSAELMQLLVEAGDAELMKSSSLAETAERPEGTQQYRGISGQNGIVKGMLRLSGAELTTERRVHKLDSRGGVWVAKARDDAMQSFNAVVFCVPGCGPGGDNLNKIHGNWETHLTKAQWQHCEVPHDCRFSLALWLAPGHEAALEKFFDSFVEKKVKKEGGLAEVVIWQSMKDGEPLDGPQVLVVHTVQGVSANKHQAESRMVREITQGLRIPSTAITSTKLITWFQSQVLSNSSIGECLVGSEEPPLVLAGDYFTASTFTGCVQSAFAAADEVARMLGEGGRGGARPKVAASAKSGAASAKTGGYPAGSPPAASAKSASAPKAKAEPRRWGAVGNSAGNAGNANVGRCNECAEQKQVFKDKSDGRHYCSKCWKAYYGKEPPAAALGA